MLSFLAGNPLLLLPKIADFSTYHLMHVCSFFRCQTVAKWEMAEDLSTPEKVIIIVVAQFAVCYLLAYCGRRLGENVSKKKRHPGVEPW